MAPLERPWLLGDPGGGLEVVDGLGDPAARQLEPAEHRLGVRAGGADAVARGHLEGRRQVGAAVLVVTQQGLGASLADQGEGQRGALAETLG